MMAGHTEIGHKKHTKKPRKFIRFETPNIFYVCQYINNKITNLIMHINIIITLNKVSLLLIATMFTTRCEFLSLGQ